MCACTRRTFLKDLAISLLSGPAMLGVASAQAAVKASGKRLVLIELDGANDGLNTLVPFRNDHYFRLRPTLALTRADRIEIDDERALHAGLEPLLGLWDRGELACVQGLGYPAPNRSHFASIALWETGGDGNRSGRDGWLTHDIEHRLGRAVNDVHGISVAGGEGLFRSDGGRWLSIRAAAQLREVASPRTSPVRPVNATVALIERRQAELANMLASLASRLDGAPAAPNFGGGSFARQLAQVMQLIRAGVDAPVYRVQLGGFDTHENQAGRHAGLLKQLGSGIERFSRALRADGQWDSTLIMTYSEFGRRAAENDSGGTDHGTAAPHLLAGGAVSGGIFASAPDLGLLTDGDPAYTLDYRALYERVLGDWFSIPNNRFASWRSAELDTLLR